MKLISAVRPTLLFKTDGKNNWLYSLNNQAESTDMQLKLSHTVVLFICLFY